MRYFAMEADTHLVRNTVRVEVTAREGQVLSAALVVEVHACKTTSQSYTSTIPAEDLLINPTVSM